MSSKRSKVVKALRFICITVACLVTVWGWRIDKLYSLVRDKYKRAFVRDLMIGLVVTSILYEFELSIIQKEDQNEKV